MNRLNFAPLLGNRNFVLFFSGQSISMIGDTFQQIALVFLVLELGGSGIELALAQACLLAPRIISLLWGGVLTDRFNIKHILWMSDLVRFIAIATVVTLIASQSLTFPLLYILFLLSGTASGFFYPAFNSIVPFIVKQKEVEIANTWVQSISQIAIFVGPVMAGFLIGTWGVTLGFTINAITYLIAVGTGFMIQMRARVPESHPNNHMVKQLMQGFRFIWRVRWLFILLIIDTVVAMAVVGAINVVLPLYIKEGLHLEADKLGIVMASFGLGSIVGMIVVPYIKRRFKTIQFFFVLEVLQGLFFIFIAIQFLGAILAALFIVGVCNGVANVILITKIHTNISKDMLGRTMSFVSLASFGAVPLSQLVYGLLVDIYSYSFIFIGASLLMIIAGGLGLLISRHKNYHFEQTEQHKLQNM